MEARINADLTTYTSHWRESNVSVVAKNTLDDGLGSRQGSIQIKIGGCTRSRVKGSSALDNYDHKKAGRALAMLYVDKSNEFRELALATGYPINGKDWEKVILNFCLDFDDCFKSWSDETVSSDHNKVHKCMTMMRQLARGKPNMTEVTKLQTIAYRIAEDFKSIYKRIE